MKQPICWRSYTLACLLTDPCFTFSFCSQHQFHIIFLLSSSYFLIASLHLDLPKYSSHHPSKEIYLFLDLAHFAIMWGIADIQLCNLKIMNKHSLYGQDDRQDIVIAGKIFNQTYRSWYSRMDQVRFVEDSLQKI